MKIIFTHHARGQLKERDINEHEINDAVTHPDGKIQEYGRTVYQQVTKRSGRHYLLRVVTIEEGDGVRIITLYRTSKISKYL